MLILILTINRKIEHKPPSEKSRPKLRTGFDSVNEPSQFRTISDRAACSISSYIF